MSTLGPASMIKKYKGLEPTEFEKLILNHLVEISATCGKDWKYSLDKLYIRAAKEVNIGGKSIALIIYPRKLATSFRKIQYNLITELEKLLLGKQVIMIAQRIIASRLPFKNPHLKKYKTPYCHTRAAMYNAVLEDIIYPAEVNGKRIAYKTDCTTTYKVLIQPKDKQYIEGRTEAYQIIYKKLTGRNLVFQYSTIN